MPVVPYAWQFRDEDVWMTSSRGPGLNGFGLLRRDHTLRFQTTTQNLTASFIVEQLEVLSLSLDRYDFLGRLIRSEARYPELKKAIESDISDVAERAIGEQNPR